MSETPRYLEKAKETYAYHRKMLLSTDKWNTTKTAKALRRSIGSISEDLMIARACRTYEKELMKIKYACDALEWLREKAREEEIEEIE